MGNLSSGRGRGGKGLFRQQPMRFEHGASRRWRAVIFQALQELLRRHPAERAAACWRDTSPPHDRVLTPLERYDVKHCRLQLRPLLLEAPHEQRVISVDGKRALWLTEAIHELRALAERPNRRRTG